MSIPDHAFMQQLASLQLSAGSTIPEVLALKQHIHHLDTLQEKPDILDEFFRKAFYEEVSAKS